MGHQRDAFVEELLSAYLDHELTRDEHARVEQILQHDPSAREVLDSLAEIRADLRALAPMQLDGQFASRVLAAAARRSAGEPKNTPIEGAALTTASLRHHGWRSWGYVAVAFSAMLLLALLLRPNRLAPSQDQLAQTPGGGTGMNHAPPKSEPAVPSSKPASRIPPAEKSPLPGKVSPAARMAGPIPTAPVPPQPLRSHGNTLDQQPQAAPSGASPSRPSSLHKPVLAARGVDRPRPDDSAAPAADAPKPPSTDQLLLVMDVYLTPKGREEAGFDATLVQQGLPFFATIPVRDKLAQALLTSRFFNQAGVAAGKTKAGRNGAATRSTPVQLVYVVARAGQMDELWRALQDDKQRVLGVSMDLAFRPIELNMFRQLRDAAQAALAAHPPADMVASADQLHTGAYRLVLPPTWRGRPTRVPADLANSDGPAAARPPGGPMALGTGRLGENLVVEILFVLHSPAAVHAKK